MVLPESEVTISPGRCAAAGHVLDGRNHRGNRNRGLKLCDGPHGADHGRAARHVVLHLLHAVGGLDREAAGIERHALADQAQVRALSRFRGRAVAQDDHRGRLGAAHGDAEQRAHAELLHAVLIENLAFEALLLGHRPRTRRQHGRSHAIGRLIHQLSRQVLRFG